MNFWGFPCGSVIKHLPASVGDKGSIPGPGRAHMPWSIYARVPQLLSLCSEARELQLLSPCTSTPEALLPQPPCSATKEATAMRSPHTAAESSLCSPQREKKPVQQQRPKNTDSQKYIHSFKKIIIKKKENELLENMPLRST